MDAPVHRLRKESLNIRCDSEDCAFALQARLSDYNALRLQPVIDRVLSEFAPADGRIVLGRLEVDLGSMRLWEFEEMAEERLDARLRSAVERAIGSPFDHREPSEAESRLEVLEWYLRRGTLPFSGSAERFSLEGWFAELMLEDPGALRGLVRRVANEGQALRRVALQLSEAARQRLVGVLEPEHASLIVAYAVDMRAIGREQRLVSLGEDEIDDFVWLLVLNYLARDASSQFNRKAFVESLILGFAQSRGIDRLDILALLARGLHTTAARRGLPSSLPAVLAQLIEESGLSVPEAPPGEDGVEIEAGDPDALARRVRREGADPKWLERFVERLDARAFVQLLGALEPRRAADLVPFLLDVRDVGLRAWATMPSSERIERLLWLHTLEWSLREAAPWPGRDAFLRSFLRRLAAEGRADLPRLVSRFREAMESRAATGSLRSSLDSSTLLDESGTDPLDADGTNELARRPSSEFGSLDVDGMRRLAFAFLPALEAPNTPVAEALRTALSGIIDPRAFYARLIAAAVRGENLDFEAFAAEVALDAPVRVPDSALSRLFTSFVGADSDEAWRFLRASMARPEAEGGSTVLDTFLALLAGPRAGFLRALTVAVGSLPPAHRPSTDAIRSVAFQEARRAASNPEVPPGFVERILASVFPDGLPDSVGRSLSAWLPPEETPASTRGLLPSEERLGGNLPHVRTLGEIFDLLSGSDAPEIDDGLALEIGERLRERSALGYEAVRRLLANPQASEGILRRLPPEAWSDMVEFVVPGGHRTLLQAERTLARAWASARPQGGGREAEKATREVLWELLRHGSPSVEGFADAVLSRLRREGRDDPEATDRFRREAVRLADAGGHAPLRDALATGSKSAPRTPSAPAERPRKPAARLESGDDAAIYVANAGLVLASPFLPHLFSRAAMVEKDEQGRDRWLGSSALSRAVHLLQYVVDGSTAASEPSFPLNKVLCGLPVSEPVKALVLTEAEKALADEMLQRAMLDRWRGLSSSSIGALRETFLQREGKLIPNGEGWKLVVQRKTLDVLLEEVSWAYSLVAFDWMPAPLSVQW